MYILNTLNLVIINIFNLVVYVWWLTLKKNLSF